MKIDLHVHTIYSPDSINGLDELVRRCNAKGITPAITDHNTIAAHAKLKSVGFEFIAGEEIKTDMGDLIGLYLNQNIPKKTPFLEAIDLIRGQGGIAYLPHMYDKLRDGIRNVELAKKADVIEIYNPRCITKGLNEKAEKFAIDNKKLIGVGSDAHFIFEIGRTYVECVEQDISEPKGLINALKNGRAYRGKPPLHPMILRPMTIIAKFGKKLAI